MLLYYGFTFSWARVATSLVLYYGFSFTLGSFEEANQKLLHQRQSFHLFGTNKTIFCRTIICVG